LNKTSLNLKIGETNIIAATISPANATYKTVIWTSGNSGVASVNNGTVTAVNSGTTTITASTVEGISATCAVTVKPPTVLLDLAAKLQTLTPQLINTQDKFYSAFGGLPVRPGDEINETSNTYVSYQIINDSGVNKLQVNVYINWGSGLIITNENFTFKAGDIIDFKGKMINGPSNSIYVNKDCWNYDPLQGWNEGFTDGQIFQRTFTLSASDAATINANAVKCGGSALSFKTGGTEPWNGTVYPAGIGKFLIEQIKIYRIE